MRYKFKQEKIKLPKYIYPVVVRWWHYFNYRLSIVSLPLITALPGNDHLIQVKKGEGVPQIYTNLPLVDVPFPCQKFVIILLIHLALLFRTFTYIHSSVQLKLLTRLDFFNMTKCAIFCNQRSRKIFSIWALHIAASESGFDNSFGAHIITNGYVLKVCMCVGIVLGFSVVVCPILF